MGCGPSLGAVPIPSHVLTVGTNLSYLKRWSPIYVTCDSGALKRDFGAAGALIYYSGIRPEKVDLGGRGIEHIRIIPMARSGTLAYYVANLLRPERIRLLGFDMDWEQGHFHEEGVRPVDYETHTKPALRHWHRRFNTPTLIWRGDWVPLEEALGKDD